VGAAAAGIDGLPSEGLPGVEIWAGRGPGGGSSYSLEKRGARKANFEGENESVGVGEQLPGEVGFLNTCARVKVVLGPTDWRTLEKKKRREIEKPATNKTHIAKKRVQWKVTNTVEESEERV